MKRPSYQEETWAYLHSSQEMEGGKNCFRRLLKQNRCKMWIRLEVPWDERLEIERY